MSKPIYLSVTVMIICAVLCRNCQAQAAQSDSSSQQSALNNAVSLYNSALGVQLPIYSGAEYYFYDPHIRGNAYFLDNNGFSKGAVYYEGTLYSDIMVLYDINADHLIGLFPNRISKFIITKERVKAFDYMGSHFINVNTDTMANNPLEGSGYYRELYNGKLQVLAKYTKSIQTSTSTSSIVENYFSQKNYFFIRKDNVYHNAGSKGAVLDVFKDRKNELRKFINANNLDFKANPEESLVKVATWYDHLSN